MLFFFVIFAITFLCFLFWGYSDAADILRPIICSALIAASLWAVAYLFVLLCVDPPMRVVDGTATLLPIDLNNGNVALGYENVSDDTGGKYYVYEDEQGEGKKYLFIEQTDDPADFGIDAKLLDTNKCKCEIRYIDDGEPCMAEYYHTEYVGFSRTIIKNGINGVTLYIHEHSMEKIWFPYSN